MAEDHQVRPPTEDHDAFLVSSAAERGGALGTVIRVIDSAPFPMFVLDGVDRRLIYNSAYIPMLGSHHPEAMTRPFFEVWPEVRELIAPVVDKAFAGEASLFEDLPVVIHRPDQERAWFTFSYSPVLEADGAVAGVLCVCTETTQAVRARLKQAFLASLEEQLREHENPDAIIQSAQSALGEYLEVSRVGYGSMDATERLFTTRNNWTSGEVEHHNGTHDLLAFGEDIYEGLKAGLRLAVSDTHTDPRALKGHAEEAFAALEVRSAATVSLIKSGRFVAALYVHHNKPRRWSEEELDLIHEVAERTWSAVERAYAQHELQSLLRRQTFLLLG